MQELKLKQQSDALTKENHKKLLDLKVELEKQEHKYMYMILNLKSLIANDDLSAVSNLIDQQIDFIAKYSTVIVSGNVFFDSILTIKLNGLWSDGRVVKTMICISPHPFYEMSNLVYFISDILDKVHLHSIYGVDIDLNIYEKNNFIVIKFVTKLLLTNNLNNEITNIMKHYPDYKYTTDVKSDFYNLSYVIPMKKYD